MTEQQLLTDIQEVFNLVFALPVTVLPELTAADVPEWDSLLQLSLIAALEQQLNVRFTTEEAISCYSISALMKAVERARSSGCR